MSTERHFDGRRFFNPGDRRRESLWDILKLMFILATAPAWRPSHRAVKPSLPASLGFGEIAVTFISHATLLIQTSRVNFLTDPVWSKRASPFQFIGPKRYRDPGLTIEELPRIDVVLISHNHYDHMDVASIRKLKERFDPLFLVAKGDERHMRRFGVTKVREFDWWESLTLDSGEVVTYAPAKHFSSRTPFDRDQSLWGGFMLNVENRKVFFAGDTGYSHHFNDIRARLGEPDIALLPIGAYEPYWFMKHVHMNPFDAVQAHQDLRARKSIAMHFGTFRLTTEAIDEPELALKRALHAANIAESEFIAPIEGQTVFAEIR